MFIGKSDKHINKFAKLFKIMTLIYILNNSTKIISLGFCSVHYFISRFIAPLFFVLYIYKMCMGVYTRLILFLFFFAHAFCSNFGKYFHKAHSEYEI